MGSPFLSQLKKNAASFMNERYKDARLFLTDTTEAEMLVEKVTNNVPCSPDARTMTRIAEASYDTRDYWRIVDVLHRRLYRVDWKQWRQSYKALVLLDFLLTHGPEEFSMEFDEDLDVIEELGSFEYRDENGIDWGLNMQKRSERVLELLKGGETLIQARLKALKITKEIHGFRNLSIFSSSPSSSSSSGSSSWILDSGTSSSSGGASSLVWSESDAQTEDELSPYVEEDMNRTHSWNSSFVQETGSLIEVEEDESKGKGKCSSSFVDGFCSKLGISPRGNRNKFGMMNDPNDGEMKKKKKKISLQFSFG